MDFYLYVPFIIFMNNFYPSIMSKSVVKISKASIWLYGLLILITPWKNYIDVIIPYRVLSLFIDLFIYKLSKSYLKSYSEYIIAMGVWALFNWNQ